MLVEDRLFATLDATTRRLELPGGETVLLTDTVGFVRKLPHQLVEAFKSTLEVVVDADLLVHVVDALGPDPEGQIDAVRERAAPRSAPATCPSSRLQQGRPRPARRSASPSRTRARSRSRRHRRGHRRAAAARSRPAPGADQRSSSCVVPYDRGDVLAAVHREGEVLVEQADDDGIRVRARLDDASPGSSTTSWSPESMLAPGLARSTRPPQVPPAAWRSQPPPARVRSEA